MNLLSIHGSYPLCTEISFAISWPFSLYVDHPLHEMAFWVNISPHESCLCFLLAWMKIHFWKLKLSHLTWVNEDSLLKAEVVAPYVYKFTHIIFTFESWSWCPLWMNENKCINMHSSNRQKRLCITCDVWNETCLAHENVLLYCLCLQRSHKYHVSCLPIPWALT